MRYVLAVVAATIVIGFSDWLLFGVWFHDRYMKTPETWRATPEGTKIAGSMTFAVVGVIAFVLLADWLQLHSVSQLACLVILTWLAASLPQTVTMTMYVKYDSALLVNHCVGWLARLAIAAVAFGVIVR